MLDFLKALDRIKERVLILTDVSEEICVARAVCGDTVILEYSFIKCKSESDNDACAYGIACVTDMLYDIGLDEIIKKCDQ